MWSIHPSQIQPIVAAMEPRGEEIANASEILLAAQRAQWGPTVTATRCTIAPGIDITGRCCDARRRRARFSGGAAAFFGPEEPNTKGS